MNDMKWQNVFEAIISAPSILLEAFVEDWQRFFKEEKELAMHGEFDEDDGE